MDMETADLRQMLAFAERTAREAGAVLKDRFGKDHDVVYKGTIDIVTEADKASEALIAERIRSAFPEHDLLGEEGTRGIASASGLQWIIDPLDGTTNFAHHLPTFGVSIGLEEHGAPLLGVVFDPMRDECFCAARGLGATLNGLPIRVSMTSELIQSLLVTGFSYDRETRVKQAHLWRAFMPQVQAVRQTGSAALNLCYIAAGRFDGYWERGISAWDVAAGACILLEAGGTITDFAGGEYSSADRVILASNGALHPAMLKMLRVHGEFAEADVHPDGGQTR